MKYDLTDLSPVRKRLSFEIAADEVERETEAVLQGYRRKAKIKGFRPGKAPAAMVRSHFGKEVKEEVRDRLLSSSFAEAAREKGLRPLGEPALEELVFEEGRPMSFNTVFEVLPELELKDYREVDVTRPSPKVTDDEVQAALEEIRRSRVQLVGEEGRKAIKGDVVYVDVEGTPVDGETITRERMPIEVGAEANLDAFNEHLLGVGAGTELEFPVDYPEDYGAKEMAGKRVDYKMTVHEVKQPILPDLDDEFAKDVGEFEDLAALELKIKTDLEARKKHESEMAARQAVMAKVLLANPVVLPEVLVEQEIRRRLEDFVRKLMMQGIDPEKQEINWEELRKQQEEPARKSVHARLVLDAVAEAEKIEVDAEAIEARLRQDAERIGESFEKLSARLKKHEGEEALTTQLVREKALDYLTSVANIHYAG